MKYIFDKKCSPRWSYLRKKVKKVKKGNLCNADTFSIGDQAYLNSCHLTDFAQKVNFDGYTTVCTTAPNNGLMAIASVRIMYCIGLMSQG